MGMSKKVEEYDSRFSATCAGDVKTGEIISEHMSGSTYFKIKDLKKVKVGKHGAAKAMITGVNIKTQKNVELTTQQSTRLFKINPTQEAYQLLFIDSDNLSLLKVNDSSVLKEVYFSDIVGGLEELKKAEANKGDDQDIVLTLVEYPAYSIIKDIRTNKQG